MTLVMAIHDLKSERLFLSGDLGRGASVLLSEEQTHYLVNVLRIKPGAILLVFNGHDGECWTDRVVTSTNTYSSGVTASATGLYCAAIATFK